MQDKIYDVVVIGAGIAGLTAGIYVTRANKKVLVLESKTHGGQIITTFHIANYPGLPKVSGVDLMNSVYNQAKELGAEVEYTEVMEVRDKGELKEVITEDYEEGSDEGKYLARALIIATGSNERKLGLKNEEKFTGRGISYCATCDGGFYKDKPVAVVGGGNTALYDALYLADVASKVYLVHRRNEFRGDAHLVEKLREKKNVEFVMESRPNKLLGDKKISGIEVINTAGEKKTLDVDGVFVAIGRVPATEQFKDIVKLDKDGYIVAGEDCHTSAEGIFVAGDCRTKTLRQLVTASSDGAMAATEAVHYLK